MTPIKIRKESIPYDKYNSHSYVMRLLYRNLSTRAERLFLHCATSHRKEEKMKITFNDATELTIQSASIRAYGSLLIKTISATEEELRTMFQDAFKTKKMIVTERESTIAEYENYTDLNAVVKYTAGILGVVMYREKESPMDRIDTLEEHVDNLTEANKSREAETAELIATVDSILTDVLPTLLGDGTEETNTENMDTK